MPELHHGERVHGRVQRLPGKIGGAWGEALMLQNLNFGVLHRTSCARGYGGGTEHSCEFPSEAHG
jgi:hypothetical protein